MYSPKTCIALMHLCMICIIASIVCAGKTHALQIDQATVSCEAAGTRLAWTWFGGYGNETTINSQEPQLPSSRQNALSWQMGATIYILGGRNRTDALSDFWGFNTTTYRWRLIDSNVSDSVGVLQNAFTVANDSHLFLYGGFNQSGEYTAMNLLQTVARSQLDQVTDADAPWELLHPSRAEVDAQDILITPIDQLLPQESWFNVKNLSYSPGPRWGGASWIVGDTFYLFGGVFKLMGGPTMADLWQWSVRANDGWTLIAGSVLPNDAAESGAYPSARFGCTSWTVGTDLWLYGGEDANGLSLADMWRFDTLARAWTRVALQAPTDPLARSGAVAFQTPGRLWIYGGTAYPGLELDDMHYFDIAQSRWVSVIAQSENDTLTMPVYGAARGAPADVGAPISTPAARTGASAAAFSSDNSGDPVFWLFGGSSAYNRYWNDVWAFKCYGSAPCGPFPFPARPDLVGECTSSGWLVPFPPPTSQPPPPPSPPLNISLPVILTGTAVVRTDETLIIVPRTFATNFTVIESKGCSTFEFGNLTLDVTDYNGTQLTLLSGVCFNYSITGLQIQAPNRCTRVTGRTLRETNRLIVLLDRKNLCKKTPVALIVGASCGGVLLLAGVCALSLMVMRRKNWPRWMWHSSAEGKHAEREMHTTYRT